MLENPPNYKMFLFWKLSWYLLSLSKENQMGRRLGHQSRDCFTVNFNQIAGDWAEFDGMAQT